jgi:hypothetical protein
VILRLAYGVLAGIGTLATLSALRPVDDDVHNDSVRDGGIIVAAMCAAAAAVLST